MVKSALRKNLTEPQVLLGFCEGLFPGAADVWKRRDSPGANVHGAFRSIQALSGTARPHSRPALANRSASGRTLGHVCYRCRCGAALAGGGSDLSKDAPHGEDGPEPS
jgi:hypothetical protein